MRHKIILIIIILLGLVIRIKSLGSFSIWGDEQTTILVSNGYKSVDINENLFSQLDYHKHNDVGGVIQSTINDNGNSLFYNISLHTWLKLFGNSDISARSFSLLSGMLLVLLSILIIDNIFKDKKLTILIAIILAVHPLLLEYSVEARSYSYATIWCVISSFALYKIAKTNKNIGLYSCLYFVSTTAALFSHYLTLPIFIAQFVIFVLNVRVIKRWGFFILPGALTLALFIFWVIGPGNSAFETMNDQNENYSALAQEYTAGDNTFAIPSSFKNVSAGIVQQQLQIFGFSFQNFGFQLREIIVFLIIPFLLIFKLKPWNKNSKNYTTVRIILIALVIQIIFSIFLAIKAGHTISMQPLYGIFLVPIVALLTSIGIKTIFTKNRLLGVTAMVFIPLLMLISSIPFHLNLNKKFPEQNLHYNLSTKIENEIDEMDTLYIRSRFDADRINLYFGDQKIILQIIDSNLNSIYHIK